ncbi:MAG: signal recognition particle-docking protein FtsY [Alphaproteobacteria bacterium]|nr:signal recognition particle-docking protein FtsY [Alphaproteobacteria bacterium]
MSLWQRLKTGLKKTSNQFGDKLQVVLTHQTLDQGALDELEDLLVESDVGATVAQRLCQSLSRKKFGQEVTELEVRECLAEEIESILAPVDVPLVIEQQKTPVVILIIGVNGAGKTTSIAKLANQWKMDGLSVELAACDTFRAAAVEQLQVWGKRLGIPVHTAPHGADAAGLAFDALTQATKNNADILCIDTAGRLHNKEGLMNELAKVIRVIKKMDPAAPHHTILVLDATTGQNALTQAGVFKEIAGVTGIIVTKLDGTARGGVVIDLAEKYGIPIHAIGVGEQEDDLQSFDARDFARAIVGLEIE